MSENLANLPDRELLSELRTFNNATLVSSAAYGLTAAEANDLKDDLDTFENELDAWDAVNAQYDAKREAKNTARQNVLDRARPQRRMVRAKSGVSNELLESANLTPYDDVKTASASPSSVPFALVDFGKLRHTISFRDKLTPDTDKKPDGMMGAEIWMKIGGDAPVDNEECEFLALDTATPYLMTFKGADAGKTAYYLLRWVSKNGDKGEWSEAVSATING